MDYNRNSLELLYRVSRELADTLDLQQVVTQVLSLSVKYAGAERASLILVDEHQQPTNAALIINGQLIQPDLDEMALTLENGLAGWVMRNREYALLLDTSKDDRWLKRPDDEKNQSGAKSAIGIPLLAHDKLEGVMTMVHGKPNQLDEADAELLRAIASQAGIAVKNARLHQSLEIAHQRYRNLFNHSIDSIFITALDNRIIEVNQQAALTTGFSMLQLCKMNMDQVHMIQEHEEIRELAKRPLDSLVSYESEIKGAEEKSIPVEVNVQGVLIDNEKHLQWIMRDISERKALDSVREDMIGMIYHDLRSPLANIISSLDMLEMLAPQEPGTSIHSIYSIATRSTERLQRLISSLLDIQRLEAGENIVKQTWVPLKGFLEEIEESVEPSVTSKQQIFSIKKPDELQEVWLDEDMIKRVLINLVENANKYSPVESKIELRIQPSDQEIRFTVADNGPGIEQKARERIFNKFSRLQASNFPKGIGLGLAFCKLAVEAHAGKIWVESELEVGSQFIFTLPINNDRQP
ncbi:MAG: PAS domain S-box protein [Anaerolineaceae bacterium]|nr:PAS domain S-box protein [Anaerolineaceae bacterium]